MLYRTHAHAILYLTFTHSACTTCMLSYTHLLPSSSITLLLLRHLLLLFSTPHSMLCVMLTSSPSGPGPSGVVPLDRAMSMRPTATNSKGRGMGSFAAMGTHNVPGAPSQMAQSNMTAPVFDEVYELPGAMFDSTDILLSTTPTGNHPSPILLCAC